MRIGINGTGLVQKASVAAIVDDVRRAQADGYASYWLAEHPTGGLDALTVLTAAGLAVPDIELGTAVVPTFPRHPMALAGQALTARGAIGDRLVLGIGLSHEVMMAQLGLPFDKPIRHLKEFLSILVPLLDEGRVDFEGETLRCQADAFFGAGAHFPVLVAALGPQALKVAGRMTDGTTLAWVGPKTIAQHIVPRIAEAAAEAGRPAPRIVATLPACVTDEPERVRARISETLAMYAKLPSYAAMFEREGVETPGELALVGSEAEVREGIGRLAEAGVTDFGASIFPTSRDEAERSRALLDGLATAGP